MADLHAIEPEPVSADLATLAADFAELVAGGTVSAVGIAVVHRDGTTRAMWTETATQSLLLGATAMLSHKIARDLDA